jgi:hypothetical protein
VDGDDGAGETAECVDLTRGYRSRLVCYRCPCYRGGRGIAPAAVRAVTDWAFSSFGGELLPNIMPVHDLGNAASCRVAIKSGYRFRELSPPNRRTGSPTGTSTWPRRRPVSSLRSPAVVSTGDFEEYCASTTPAGTSGSTPALIRGNTARYLTRDLTPNELHPFAFFGAGWLSEHVSVDLTVLLQV